MAMPRPAYWKREEWESWKKTESYRKSLEYYKSLGIVVVS